MKQISDRIFYCGIMNPNMRVFDVIMRTEYGTSYNSYVIRGSEKVAIVDASHHHFSAVYREELRAALGGAAPDYLVVNHTEPDHSGAIGDLLEAYPGLTIVTNAVAAKNLRQIINRGDLPLQIIKDGGCLSLGDVSLQFIVAPFLHWPDTMMTYVPEEQALFSCDVFGCHYCEPGILDTRIGYPADYELALRQYFDCIFGPFRPFVVKGLNKLEGLPLQLVCPSHGPVLTRGARLANALAQYAAWARTEARQPLSVPIFYSSAYGNTEQIAAAMRAGIVEILPDAACDLVKLDARTGEYAAAWALLNECDAFLLGSPTINRDAVPPLWQLLSQFDAVNSPKRPCALFGSYGWSGEACGNLAQRLEQLKCRLFEAPFLVNFVPTEEDLSRAAALGTRFARALL
ncbi:MAG: FprA family A-type flavoprotein [Oscillospiraceae bacterium]|nr:FprA family A-type flavoprotein [Oscillospiraceae bacterium]